MSVVVPGMLGIVFKKNEKTKPLIIKEIDFLKRFARGRDISLNEDQFLIGFSVAMNGSDLAQTIADLKASGAAEGEDFVATSAHDGVIGQIPAWLRIESESPTDETTGEAQFQRLHYVGNNNA